MTNDVRQNTVEGSGYVVGEFRCPPDSARWHQENRIQGGPLFVFPFTPVEIAHADGGSVVADPNQVLFYNEGQLYRRRLLDRRGDRCVYVWLDPHDVRDILRDVGVPFRDEPNAPFSIFHGPGRPGMYLRHMAIARHVFHAAHRDDLFVQENLLMMFRSAVGLARQSVGLGASRRSGPDKDAARRRRGEEAVRAAQRTIAARFDESLSLAALGAEVDLSPFHLARLFRKHLGMTVHAYREQLRLLRGLQRLLDGERLLDLALDVGFSSHSHFTRAFRRMFRQAPSEVRAVLSSSQVDLRTVSRLIDDLPVMEAA